MSAKRVDSPHASSLFHAATSPFHAKGILISVLTTYSLFLVACSLFPAPCSMVHLLGPASVVLHHFPVDLPTRVCSRGARCSVRHTYEWSSKADGRSPLTCRFSRSPGRSRCHHAHHVRRALRQDKSDTGLRRVLAFHHNRRDPGVSARNLINHINSHSSCICPLDVLLRMVRIGLEDDTKPRSPSPQWSVWSVGNLDAGLSRR